MSNNIAVKFCGNCNPYIDTGEILRLVQEKLPNHRFVFHEYDQSRILLVLSGCRVDCAGRPAFTGPVIVVAGEAIDRIYCPEKQLPQEIVNYIRYLEGRQ